MLLINKSVSSWVNLCFSGGMADGFKSRIVVNLSLLDNCSGINSMSVSSSSATSGLGANMGDTALAASILPIMVPAFKTICLLVRFLTPTATLGSSWFDKTITSDFSNVSVSDY